MSLAFLPSFFWERDEEAGFPQSHGEEKSLEDLGGDKWGRGWAFGCPSPTDADDGTRALGALLWVGGSRGGLRGAGGGAGG